MTRLDILKSILRIKFKNRHPVLKYTRRQSLKSSYVWSIQKHEIKSLIKDIKNEN